MKSFFFQDADLSQPTSRSKTWGDDVYFTDFTAEEERRIKYYQYIATDYKFLSSVSHDIEELLVYCAYMGKQCSPA